MRGKRWLPALLLAALLLAGCKRSDVTQTFGNTLKEWNPHYNTNDTPSQRQSSIVDYATPEFGPTLGFGVTAYPDDDQLALSTCYAIDEWFGQVEYTTPDDWVLVLRVAQDDAKKLATVYNESHARDAEEWEVDGTLVTQKTGSEGCAIATWAKDGFQYSFHSNKKQGRIPQELVDKVVAGVETADA